jgi:alpha,alpha-trehalose phosphorylase
MDLCDLEGNTSFGLHLGALAGAWSAVVAGFGGLRVRPDGLAFAPRLPAALAHVAFRVCYRGSRICAVVTAPVTRYRVVSGKPLTVLHHDQLVEIGAEPVEVPNPVPAAGPPAVQPPGRRPASRSGHPGG